MNWNIEPLVGLGPLRLGMSSQDVANILDPMHKITDKSAVFDGSISEHRGLELPICSYDDDQLRGIETSYRVKNVTFYGKDVYSANPKDIMLMIYDRNGGAQYGLGILLFEPLTIATTGFFLGKQGFFVNSPDRQDERTVSVYRAKSYDAVLSHFKKVDLKKYK